MHLVIEQKLYIWSALCNFFFMYTISKQEHPIFVATLSKREVEAVIVIHALNFQKEVA